MQRTKCAFDRQLSLMRDPYRKSAQKKDFKKKRDSIVKC